MIDHNQFETVYDRLKKIRLEKNFSQDYLAKKLGLSQKAYSKIENNESKLSVENLQRISEILNVPVEQFFSTNNQPVLNDFSNRTGGDNVIYKNFNEDKIDELYTSLIKAKDELLKAKDNEIATLKNLIEKRQNKY